MNEQWQACLKELRGLFGANISATWFDPLEFLDFDPNTGKMRLAVPRSKFDSVRQNYLNTIEQIARRAFKTSQIDITLVRQGDATAPDITPSPAPVTPVSDDRARQAGLMPSLTFENFVHGSANQLAVAAAEHVAATMGSPYNPLYIYGGVGLGKTHLMHAIGHRYLELHPKARVRCITAQDFINEFTAATRAVNDSNSTKPLQQFDERYRTLDLLLIDDVQSFSGAKGSQAQFFRAFEALVPHNKQLVLTSDTYARGLTDMAPRLISRIAQGLSVAIEPPELDLRIAILLNKAKAMNIELGEEVATFIAKRLKSNVRELEGALQQIIAYQQFQPASVRDITIDVAKRVLRDQFSATNHVVSLESIQKAVADYYQLKVADMYSKRRPANIVLPRQIAMYLAKTLTQHSYPEIGENFGGRNHATVIHAVRKISQDRLNNPELNHELHVLEQIIKG